MKRLFSFLALVLAVNLSISQANNNTIDFIVVMKEGYNLDYFQKSIREDGYYSFELRNDDLKSFVNSKPIYDIKKEYPTARTPYLQRVYRITSNSDELLNSLINRNEIEFAELYIEPLPLNLPNDYNTPDDGEKNTALELIRAPMTWGIATGDLNTFVGISDLTYEFTHEDIVNKIHQNLNGITAISTQNGNHGTQVAGMLCSNDNSIGSSSIAPNIKMVTASSGINNLLLLSQQPGVRVVNASWASACSFIPHQNLVIQEIINGTDVTPPVVVVAAAGNLNTCGNFTNYVYPASYPGVISIGGINHWQPRNTTNPDPLIGNKFWEDICSIEPLNQNNNNTFNPLGVII